MKHRMWPVLLAGLGLLFILITIAALTSTGKTHQIYNDLLENQRRSRNYIRLLDELKGSVYATAVSTRDLIIEPTSPEHPARLRRLLADNRKQVLDIKRLTKPDDHELVDVLAHDVDDYSKLVEPMLDWPEDQRAQLGPLYLRRDLRGRRTALVSTIGKISALHQANIDQEDLVSREINAQLASYLRSTMLVTTFLGLLIVGGSVLRLTQLERRGHEHRRRLEEAEYAMRELSHKVVHAQEEERRSISRELHDEVGQMLTALRIELGNLKQNPSGGELQAALSETKSLAERCLRSVRDIAMGLRPSMLDDLGLAPAVEWQAREFARRLGIPVQVELEGNLEPLSDAHRTCIYRVVQEALTNCARHAGAGRIVISIRNAKGNLEVRISDNGRGMRTTADRSGMGLLGMKERVRELDGRLEIISSPGGGTTIQVSVPLEKGVAA